MKVKSKDKKWRYVLIVNGAGSYFADSLWELITELFEHRLWHWKRGDGWTD